MVIIGDLNQVFWNTLCVSRMTTSICGFLQSCNISLIFILYSRYVVIELIIVLEVEEEIFL